MFTKECILGPNYVGETIKEDEAHYRKCECTYQCSDREGNPTHEVTAIGDKPCYYYKTEVFNDYECTYSFMGICLRTEKGKAGPRYAKTWCCEGCNYVLTSLCGDPNYYYISDTLEPCDKGHDCESPGKG